MHSDKILAGMLSDKESIGTTLLIGLMDRFGTEMLNWAPETLTKEAHSEYGVLIPAVNQDKLNALVTCITTDMFYSNLDVFLQTCRSLSGAEAEFETFDPADSHELAWGITEMSLVDPPEEGERFNEEIRSYIGLKLNEEGLTSPPAVLKPHADMPDLTQDINDSLEGDGIEAKSYWDSQQETKIAIEGFVASRLQQLAESLAQLPLQSARKGAQQEFLRRVQTALSTQASSAQQASEALQPGPSARDL